MGAEDRSSLKLEVLHIHAEVAARQYSEHSNTVSVSCKIFMPQDVGGTWNLKSIRHR